MALLIFPPDNLGPQLAGLLDPDLRQSVATRVNEAILNNQGYKSQARLTSLIRLRMWAEKKAREEGKDLPKILDLWAEGDFGGREAEDSVMGGNREVEPEPEPMTT